MRLGDGDDEASALFSDIAVEVYGEAGADRIAGTLTDGGEGNDVVQGDDARGGPGDDQVLGSRLLDGGDGNDVLHKTFGRAAGQLSGGAGNDSLQSDDGFVDELRCGDGQDVIVAADPTDRNDGTCESGAGVKVAPEPSAPQVTVFELRGFKARPDRHGRLAVWMACNVPKCEVSVRLLSAGDLGVKGYVRFRKPPLRHVVVSNTAKLVRLPLNGAQRNVLRHTTTGSAVGAIVTTKRPGRDHTLITDSLFCTRDDPCE
jgi:hypothetical protein